jgi:hypothetical protein
VEEGIVGVGFDEFATIINKMKKTTMAPNTPSAKKPFVDC